MNITTFIDEISLKYNYSYEMQEFLHSSVPVILKYFMPEDTVQVYSALTNCEIHFEQEKENIREYIDKIFDENNAQIGMYARGTYIQRFRADNGKISEKQLIYISRQDNNKQFDLSKEKNRSILVHEIIHLITSFNKHQIDGDILINNSGLCSKERRFDPATGYFSQQSIKYKYLDEAMNSFFERYLMSIITGRKYELSGGYKNICNCIDMISMYNSELFCQLCDDKKRGQHTFEEVIGLDNALKLEELIEHIFDYSRAYPKYSNSIEERENCFLDNLNSFKKFIREMPKKQIK